MRTDNLTNEQKHALILGGFCVLAAIILGGIIYPTVNYIHKINADTYQLRLYLEKKYENVMKLHTSKEQVWNIKDKVASYEKFLYSTGDELKLITLLENMADSYQIQQSINNTNLDKIAGRQIEFNLSANGKYTQLLKYLDALEHSTYLFNITNLNILPIKNRDGSAIDTVTAHFTLSLYVSQ
ncbi:MAG: hypothetical protein A2261_00870 [Candidatus Magasanikbacteria bacterium RIFOXYA2_FULL_44_8]|uniref:Pilus assembly protein PilO n=1 Tax=Candidatus Magasanikbacteria bacterium RIFOXYA2_FULL_44_8 TaxID=1798696 RepID=A0A1F6NKB7_9BACT|nr:MAG: hypothetical protein A2261_00870 [Candidatus Magasanikbacteria bacterium RIFOXYA2_FULL_44_8]